MRGEGSKLWRETSRAKLGMIALGQKRSCVVAVELADVG